MRRTLRWLAGALVALLLLVLAAGGWLLHTESGLRWALATGIGAAGRKDRLQRRARHARRWLRDRRAARRTAETAHRCHATAVAPAPIQIVARRTVSGGAADWSVPSTPCCPIPRRAGGDRRTSGQHRPAVRRGAAEHRSGGQQVRLRWRRQAGVLGRRQRDRDPRRQAIDRRAGAAPGRSVDARERRRRHHDAAGPARSPPRANGPCRRCCIAASCGCPAISMRWRWKWRWKAAGKCAGRQSGATAGCAGCCRAPRRDAAGSGQLRYRRTDRQARSRSGLRLDRQQTRRQRSHRDRWPCPGSRHHRPCACRSAVACRYAQARVGRGRTADIDRSLANESGGRAGNAGGRTRSILAWRLAWRAGLDTAAGQRHAGADRPCGRMAGRVRRYLEPRRTERAAEVERQRQGRADCGRPIADRPGTEPAQVRWRGRLGRADRSGLQPGRHRARSGTAGAALAGQSSMPRRGWMPPSASRPAGRWPSPS